MNDFSKQIEDYIRQSIPKSIDISTELKNNADGSGNEILREILAIVKDNQARIKNLQWRAFLNHLNEKHKRVEDEYRGKFYE